MSDTLLKAKNTWLKLNLLKQEEKYKLFIPITMCFVWHTSESQKYLIKNRSTTGRIKIETIHPDK